MKIDTSVRMRDDLAEEGYNVPAWATLDSAEVFLEASDLQGARFLPDLCSDDDIEYSFNRIELKDGRIFLMVGADLDFGTPRKEITNVN